MSGEPTPAEIVRSLTKAQREILRMAKPASDAGLIIPAGGWMNHMPEWPHGISQPYSAMRDILTPLGLAVRAELERLDDGQN